MVLGVGVDMGWLTHVLVGGFQDVPWFCHVFFRWVKSIYSTRKYSYHYIQFDKLKGKLVRKMPIGEENKESRKRPRDSLNELENNKK